MLLNNDDVRGGAQQTIIIDDEICYLTPDVANLDGIPGI